MRVLAGRYRLGDAVGRGGSAIVHRGFDRTLKRHVAVKLFFPYGSSGDEPSAEVLREARTAAGLNHPNVARIYDYGEVTDEGERTPYLVMELLEGQTLADRLSDFGALEWRHAAEICADVASALAAAHEQDLVHRDVKPRNVMLTPGGVKVLDFGIAAAAGQNSFDTHGRLWGTPAHLAPEQLRGEPTYQAADVYALGLILFECLTGKRAWPGQTVGEILASRHERQAPRLPRVAGLPREITRLYETCTADDPTRRPTAEAAAAVLRAAAAPAPVMRPAITATIGPALARGRSRRRAAMTGAAAVVTAMLSILGLQLANGASTPGGHKAEAAVEGGAPAAVPTTSAATPAPTASSEPVSNATAVVPVTVHRTAAPQGTYTRKPKPSSSPTPSESPEPSSPPASPSTSPSPDDESTPPDTPGDNPSPTATDDPTDEPEPTPDDPTPTDEDPQPPVEG